ncbi:BolA family protein [Undibacterium oligocarboniphilum]|uniref:BolA family transcriptional regulator n=1 Tax=Undibacterium oligocarboniphilum TaxID=666702 RepID=A0A850Q919_9BURK|nr:BolA family protein [Undibacterium oligocarboniphilum]MBC3868801.1 BolA family transcriptional regulator [Undibacterium oligocarboniphilum]NVO76782.1 BolA family transcriptional regulator [Undibacterium oligocarboniphilum]
MMSRFEKLQHRLQEGLQPIECYLQDDSAAHAGHAGAASGGSHYSVKIICQQFEGLNRISRHRLVYDAVGDMMHTEVHALAITALAPSEIPT